ncbi:MAG: hypothetical protein JWQ09_57, partial [Segetibacter sp.]|nr:hypothetical protein [Segetibacter sp.]
RIALNAWKQPGIASSFNILPVSLNYSSFTRFRKSVIINFGKPIKKNDTPTETPEGEQITELNKLIYSRLEKGVITEENDKSLPAFLLSNFSFFKGNDKELIPTLKAKQSVLNNNFGEYFDRLHGTKKVALKTIHRFMYLLLIPVLFIPAIIGFAIHLPLYFPINNLIKKKIEGTVFYHSALFAALLISYPVYALIISVILVIISGNYFFLFCLSAMPFLAYTFLLWKDCVEGVINYYKLSGSVKEALM